MGTGKTFPWKKNMRNCEYCQVIAGTEQVINNDEAFGLG
jgi:hypothetical protein